MFAGGVVANDTLVFCVLSELMRNSTKLKTLLMKYTIYLELDDDELFRMVLTDKSNHSSAQVEGTSYSMVLSKAYSHLLKEMKKLKK